MIFDLVNNNPVITIEGLHVPEFKAIWKKDKSENKLKASGALSYVYHVASPISAYHKGDPDKLEALAYKDYIIGDWFPKELIDAAIDKVKLLEETSEMRFLKSVEHSLAKLAEYNYSVDFNPDEEGKKASDVKEVIIAIEKAGKMFESIAQLKDKVNSQKTQKRKIKRDVTPSSILHD